MAGARANAWIMSDQTYDTHVRCINVVSVARCAQMLIKPSENCNFERPNSLSFGDHGAPKNYFAALVFKTIVFAKASGMKAEIVSENNSRKQFFFPKESNLVIKGKILFPNALYSVTQGSHQGNDQGNEQGNAQGNPG